MLSLVHSSHNYWHPITATSFPQENSSEFSPMIPEVFGEHLIRDQTLFLHPESLQILQINSFFSSVHHTHVDWDGHARSFILCSVTHFLPPVEKQAHNIIDPAVYLTVSIGCLLSLFVLNSSGGFAAKKLFFQFHLTIEASPI